MYRECTSGRLARAAGWCSCAELAYCGRSCSHVSVALEAETDGQLAVRDSGASKPPHRAALRVLVAATGGSKLYRPPSLRLRGDRRRAQPACVRIDSRRLRGANVDRLRHRLRAPVGATSSVAQPADRLRPLPQEAREKVVLPVPARSEIGHPGGRRRAHRDPLRGRRLPARAPPGLPGGPAPATASHVLLEGHSTHNPVLPSDGDPFRRRPPLSRRGLRLLRTRWSLRVSDLRRHLDPSPAHRHLRLQLGRRRRRTSSLSFLPIENIRRRRAGRCLTLACLFSTIHQKAKHEPHRVWSQVLPVPTKTKITVPHTTARASPLLVPSTRLILMTAAFVAIVPCHPS